MVFLLLSLRSPHYVLISTFNTTFLRKFMGALSKTEEKAAKIKKPHFLDQGALLS